MAVHQVAWRIALLNNAEQKKDEILRSDKSELRMTKSEELRMTESEGMTTSKELCMTQLPLIAVIIRHAVWRIDFSPYFHYNE